MPSIVCETWFILFSSYKFPELSSTAPAERVRSFSNVPKVTLLVRDTAGRSQKHFMHGQRLAQHAVLIYGAAPLPHMYG